MADFTALKTAIQNAIKQNGNEEITGNLLQEVLLAIVTTLGDSSINDLISALNTESNARQLGDSTLQGNINSVTSAITAINYAIANGCVYAGIATPTTTPVTGRVFYLALMAGTYTNFGEIVVTQGINILKYNGSAWSLDAFIGIDDTPTPSSNNLVKSGGAFDEVMKNGSAFDLSAYNGGATYADLNAALTALNALPAAYKRGGMSMKFVQSSDNKYVQYRLMADEWITDTNDWAIYNESVYVENPRFLEVTTDSEDKVLEGIQADGTKVIGGDLNVGGSASISGNIRVLGNMNVSGVSYKIIENPEYLAAWVDAENKVIFGLKADGKTFVGDADFLDDLKRIKEFLPLGSNVDWEALSIITLTDNLEFLDVETDSEGKILSSRNTNGVKKEYVGFETPKVSIDGHTIENIEDPEGRSEITTDGEGKVISYRDSDGVKHEEVGIDTPTLQGVKTINGVPINALGGGSDSIITREFNLPKYGDIDIQKEISFTDGENSYAPTKISKVSEKYYVTSSLVDGQVVESSIEVTIVEIDVDTSTWPVDKTKHFCKVKIDFGEYLNGTFYVQVAYQGNSSLIFPDFLKKNFRFTFYKNVLFSKKMNVKIGEFVTTKKFNVKSYWLDKALIREPFCYRAVQAIYETREYNKQYPWNKNYSIFCGANGLSTNFATRVSTSGNFYGVMWFGLAKDANNVMLDDEEMNGIWVQCRTNYSYTAWSVFNGNEWEDLLADTEIITDQNDCYPYLVAFWDFLRTTWTKEAVVQHMDVESWIDAIIILECFGLIDSVENNVILYAGADKTIFYPLFYDLDASLYYSERLFNDVSILENGVGEAKDKSIWNKFNNLYWSEICDRYKDLRNGVLNPDYLSQYMQNLSRIIPYDDYVEEVERWGTGRETNPYHWVGTLNENIQWLKHRIEWLDTYFKY